MSIPVFQHRETKSVVQLLVDDSANRIVQIQFPGSRKVERMDHRDFLDQFEAVPEEWGSYMVAKAIVDHAEQAAIESLISEANSHPRSIVAMRNGVEFAPSTELLARIEANQAAILAGLNQLSRFLKMDWQEIEAAQ